MEEPHGRAPIRVQQKSYPRDNYPGSVCSPVGRRYGADADLRRSNPARWACRAWLDAGNSRDWRFHDGVGSGACAADEAGWPNLALVCLRIWNCDYPVWVIENFLVIARFIISYRRVR